MKRLLIVCALALGFTGCTLMKMPGPPMAVLTADQAAIVEDLGLDAEEIAILEAKPLYKFTEKEVDKYLAFVKRDEPNLPDRVVRIGRKNLGQPYDMYLLGEFPFETYDPQPLYSLEKSDCVVFSEHSYAMALSDDWPSFFAMLQRIRYKNGQIGVVTRNHYTEADWDQNNSWLVRDISGELAGDDTRYYNQTVNRSRFLKGRYDLETDIPVEKIEVSYVPHEKVPEISDQLRNGDFVNVIVGREDGGLWATHTGLIAIADDGTVNFLHSTSPRVREQSLQSYIDNAIDKKPERLESNKAFLWGFKFLRLQQDPVANLIKIDGPNAPVLRAPMESVVGK